MSNISVSNQPFQTNRKNKIYIGRKERWGKISRVKVKNKTRTLSIRWNRLEFEGKINIFSDDLFYLDISRRDGCTRVGALFPELSPASNGFWIHSGPFSTFSLSIFHREKREIRRERERELVSSMINPLITYLPV